MSEKSSVMSAIETEYDAMYARGQVRKVGISLGELANTELGAKIFNALRSSSAEEFRTARGERALVIKAETLEKLQKQLHFHLVAALDGTFQVIPDDVKTSAV